jgi:hypothetical protein
MKPDWLAKLWLTIILQTTLDSSAKDILVTKTLVQAGRLLDIEVF